MMMMKRAAVAVVALLVVVGAAALMPHHASASPDDDEIDETNVVVLTEDTFDEATSGDKIVLVEFYAPWCGHCQRLAPEYAKAATELAEATDKVVLAKVDATVHAGLAHAHDVTGYPTLKIFRDGTSYDYEGGRSAEDIVRVMLEHADSGWEPPKDPVITLTSENFDNVVNKEPLILVEFYAPWCGHCKKLAPEYEKAARDLDEHEPKIPLAKVDATEEQELATRFEVTGYPTLLVFRKGKHFPFSGQRTRHGIVDEMRELSQPPAEKLETVFDVDSIIDGEDPVVIGFFQSEDSPALEVFQDAASMDRKRFKYAYAIADPIREAYNVQDNKVVVFQPKKLHSSLEKPSVARSVGDDAKDLNAWIKKHGYPVVGHRTNRGVEATQYTDARPLVVLYFEADFSDDLRDETNFWREKLVKLALDKYPDKVNKDLFLAVASEEEFSQELKDFKRAATDEEFTVAILDNDNLKYLMEDEFDMDNLGSFIDDFLAGNLKPFLKSEPVPKKNKGPVVKVVADNFDEIVNDETKDVLLEFYAPWCGHCKALRPKYKKLAKKLGKVDDVVVAAMDATANDVPPQYTIKGYPTIFFVPRDAKSDPVEYHGEREVDDFLSFLRNKSSAKIPKFKKKKTQDKPTTTVEASSSSPDTEKTEPQRDEL